MLDRRLGGGQTEDQRGGQAARVAADRHAADLDPGSVQAGKRPAVLMPQHPAFAIHGEPADGVRYRRGDLHGPERRDPHGHGGFAPRG